MAGRELFCNPSVPGVSSPLTRLTVAITTTPAAGTVETITTPGAAPASLQATGQFRLLAEAEILLVTAAATATWTVVRGAEGTTPAPHASGTPLTLVVTEGTLEAFLQAAPIVQPVVVGTAGTFTLPATGEDFILNMRQAGVTTWTVNAPSTANRQRLRYWLLIGHTATVTLTNHADLFLNPFSKTYQTSGLVVITEEFVTLGGAYPNTWFDAKLRQQEIQPLHQIYSVPSGANPTQVIDALTYYGATNVGTPVGSLGVSHSVKFGYDGVGVVSGVRGSVNAYTATVDGLASGDPGNELAAYMGWLRWGAGSVGRAWFADFTLQGPIGSQPGLLNGITMFINNYYNGSPGPVASPAAGEWIVTRPGGGSGTDDGHGTATSYKVDVGLGIAGYAGVPGGTHTRGFEVGIQIGGYGSGWMLNTESSIIGTGIAIKDTQDQAIAITPRAAAGGIVWGGDTNLYSPSSGIVKTDGKLAAVAGVAVGNAASASVPGTVVKKMEVFDVSGSSLGFVPIYSAIT